MYVCYILYNFYQFLLYCPPLEYTISSLREENMIYTLISWKNLAHVTIQIIVDYLVKWAWQNPEELCGRQDLKGSPRSQSLVYTPV